MCVCHFRLWNLLYHNSQVNPTTSLSRKPFFEFPNFRKRIDKTQLYLSASVYKYMIYTLLSLYHKKVILISTCILFDYCSFFSSYLRIWHTLYTLLLHKFVTSQYDYNNLHLRPSRVFIFHLYFAHN